MTWHQGFLDKSEFGNRQIFNRISRFAITFCIAALFAVAVIVVNHDFFSFPKAVNNAILLYFATALFVAFCVDTARQTLSGRYVVTIAVVGDLMILLNALYFWKIASGASEAGMDGFSTAQFFDIASISLIACASPFIIPFLLKKEMQLWHFVRSFLINAAIAGVVATLLLGGTLLLVASAEQLFDGVNQKLYLDCFAVVGCFIFPAMVMMRTKSVSEGEIGQLDDKFSLILFRLFAILLSFFLLMIYFYIAKILFTWELPQGKVAIPVCSLMALVLLLWCIGYGIKWGQNSPEANFLRILPFLVLPALLLMSVGTARRIIDYGMTAPRLYLILLNVWFYCICLYISFRRRIIPIILSLMIGMLLFCCGPLSAWRLFPETEEQQRENVMEQTEQTNEKSGTDIVLLPTPY